MTNNDHERIADLFDRLVAMAPEQRQRMLAELDPDERAAMQRLLDADALHGDPLAEALADVAPDSARAGMRLGDYRVIRELGAGGMGTVLLAERADGQYSQRVAIKLIRGFPTRDGQRRLRQERQILAALDHPNIARLLDGGETTDGQPYVVMEYVEGRPLLAHVAAFSLNQKQRLALWDQIADAVQHAHQRLVIHRDLKPANVLVREDGEPKLLDFGVAKLIDVGADSARQTSTRVWTPGYASPEQRAGETITTAADVHALGIVLREMLTGDRGQHCPGERFRDDLPAGFQRLAMDRELRAVVEMATAVLPRDRYATVDALRDDVTRYQNHRPLQAMRVAPLYRLRKFALRHRMGVFSGLLAALLLTTFVWRLAAERDRALVAERKADSALRAAERDAATARSALSFLTDAFAAAAPEQAMRSEVSVRELLDYARAALDARGENARIRQPMERLLGHVYTSMGETQIAQDLFERGLEGVVPTDAREALALANDFDGQASVLGTLERGADSLVAAQQAQQLRQRFAPDDPLEQLNSQSQLAFAYYALNDFERAQSLWGQVIALGPAMDKPPVDTILNCYQASGSTWLGTGDVPRALQMARDGLVFADKHLPAESPARVNLLRLLGEALTKNGEAAEGEAPIREAIALQQRTVGDGGSRMAGLYNALGMTLNDLGRYREASEAFDLSRLKSGLVAGSRHMDDAISLSNSASVAESAGDYAKALDLFQQAEQLAAASQTEADVVIRRMLETNVARCLGLAGRPAEARDRLLALRRRAIALDGEDGSEVAMVTWQLAALARREGDLENGPELLADATRRLSKLVPPEHPVLAFAGRHRAEFTRLRGNLLVAESEQRAALAALEKASRPVDVAIARAELAGILQQRDQVDEAARELGAALPVLRESLLPGEVSRAAAEKLATRLNLSAKATLNRRRALDVE